MAEEHGSTTVIKRGWHPAAAKMLASLTDDVVHHHELGWTDGYATRVGSDTKVLTRCRRLQPFAKEKVGALLHLI